ncbi:DUF551 domain-containing protein [Klebsiella electrica]
MTSKLTIEQTQQIIDAADAVITALAGTNDEVHKDDTDKMVRLWDDLNDRYAPPEVVRELARMALAAMDSEPFAYIIQDKYERERGVEGHLSRSHVSKYVSQEDISEHEIACTPLYRHSQPAPASEPITVTDDMAYAFHHALTDSMIGADDVEEIKTGLRAVFANLTAPVVSAKCPERLPCSVLLEPGLRFGKGIKTSTVLAALARRAVYESDMAALSPEEKAEFRQKIADFKALIAQPAPVVPDDVMDALHKVARIRLDLNDFDGDRRGIADCLGDAEEALIEVVNRRAAMLAAAPQPQNAPQNIPEIIPGWIPVSERLPEDDDFVYIWPRPDFGVDLHVGQYCECSPKGEGWYAQVYEQNYGIDWHPITVTHWMPLPAAPQDAQDDINALIPLVSRN